MDDAVKTMIARIAMLETEHAALVARVELGATRQRSMLTMLKELTTNAADAARSAAEATAKALLITQATATAAKQAAIAKAKVAAEEALASAQLAAAIAADSAASALDAWKACLIAAGHTTDSDLLRTSTQASAYSNAASAAAANALQEFNDAFEAVKRSMA